MKNIKILSFIIVMLISFVTFGQERTITGTVTDANGPLPGANVIVKHTQRGVITDFYGNYSIKAAKGEILIFTFLGMCEETKPVTDVNSIDIIMQEEPVSLETVILPYSPGIKKRTSQTISCGKTVTAEEIELKPKSESKGYTCRVQRTIPGNNEPLIVVDNKIISKMELEKIPSEKIKSVNVLKGAQGTALYGSEGVNGVIIITTKNLTRKEIRELKKQSKIKLLKKQDSIIIR